jgi:hypothetical protein
MRIVLYICKNSYYQVDKKEILIMCVEKRAPKYTIGVSFGWDRYCEKQYGGTSEIKNDPPTFAFCVAG